MTSEQALIILKMVEAHDPMVIEAKKLAMDALRNPEKQFAKWVEDGYEDWYPTCSYCGYMAQDETNYCPNCGAKMEGKE